MTKLFRDHSLLRKLNSDALRSSKVRVVNADAFPWLEEHGGQFDFVAVDFPDPTNYGLGKLYTTAFYRLLKRHLAPGAYISVQSTSPLFARQSFWCIHETIRAAGFNTWPYHVYVPSFGEWGFVLAGKGSYIPPQVPKGLRFLDQTSLAGLFQFPADMAAVPVEPNKLNDQVLVRYYDKEWREIAH